MLKCLKVKCVAFKQVLHEEKEKYGLQVHHSPVTLPTVFSKFIRLILENLVSAGWWSPLDSVSLNKVPGPGLESHFKLNHPVSFQELATGTWGSRLCLLELHRGEELHERPFPTTCKEKQRPVMWRKWRGLREAEERDFMTLSRRRVQWNVRVWKSWTESQDKK